MTEREIAAMRDFDLLRALELNAQLRQMRVDGIYDSQGRTINFPLLMLIGDRLRRELLKRLTTFRRPKGFQVSLGFDL